MKTLFCATITALLLLFLGIAVPGQASRVLTHLERGEVSFNMPQVNRQIYHLEGAVNRLVAGVVFAAFLFGGVLLVQGGDETVGYIFWGLSAVALLWMIFFSKGHSPWRSP